MLSYEVNAKPTEPVGIIENSPLKCNCANLAWYDKRNGDSHAPQRNGRNGGEEWGQGGMGTVTIVWYVLALKMKSTV